MCGKSLVGSLCGRVQSLGLLCCERLRDGIQRLVPGESSLRMLGLAVLALAMVVGASNPAHATAIDYSDAASYASFGLSVGTLFGILVPALAAVLLPMVVASICLAIAYFTWSFVKGKAFGSA
jgi:hypothetical protein